MNNPDWRYLLREAVDYDLLANRLWLPYILSSETPSDAIVYNHILAASTVWITRVEGTSLPKMPTVPLTDESLTDLNRRWIAAVDVEDFGHVIDYKNTLGEPYAMTFGDIARHALNHGTYHRGQLRGEFGARGAEFPDTDFMIFARERNGV